MSYFVANELLVDIFHFRYVNVWLGHVHKSPLFFDFTIHKQNEYECLLSVSPGVCSHHGYPSQDAEVPR